jgi:hypothetical protein
MEGFFFLSGHSVGRNFGLLLADRLNHQWQQLGFLLPGEMAGSGAEFPQNDNQILTFLISKNFLPPVACHGESLCHGVCLRSVQILLFHIL